MSHTANKPIIPFVSLGCCGRIVKLTEDEEAENWKILPHPKDPEFEIKARIVPSSITYGTIRNKGDLRWFKLFMIFYTYILVCSISIMFIVYLYRTFELFRMQNLPHSYDIQFLDAFKMKMRDVPEQLMTTMMYHGKKFKIYKPTFV